MGLAYVFIRSGGEWTEQATLAVSDGALGGVLGFVGRSGPRHGGGWGVARRRRMPWGSEL